MISFRVFTISLLFFFLFKNILLKKKNKKIQDIKQNNSDKKRLSSPSSLSLGIMIVSFFFVGSLYTRVKFLEKELGTYKSGTQVAGVQVEAKGNGTDQVQP